MTEENSQDSATTNVVATGVTITDITSKLGSFVRLKITVSSSAGRGVFSVWALPKRS